MTFVIILGAFLCAGIAADPAAAQEKDKVLGTSEDSRGFEKRHTEADLMFETGQQFMTAKKYDKAAVEFEKCLAADPSRLDALHELGKAYTFLNAYDKAAAAYKKAAELYPEDMRLLTNLGYYQMRAKLPEDAMATYKQIVEVEPDSYEGNRWLGYLYEKSDQPDLALKHYEKAIAAKPDDVKTTGSMAKIYMEKGDTERALELYEVAMANADEEAATKMRSQLGKLYLDNKDYAKAAELFGELAMAQPDKWNYHFNQALSLYQEKKYPESIPPFERTIELKPDMYQAYRPLADAYIRAGQFSKASTTAQAGLKVTDKKGGLYCMWGKSLEKQGMYDDAIDKFQLALSDPQWGGYARDHIKRQEDLKKRAKAMGSN